MNSRLDEIKLHYQSAISIWEGFCLLHRELLDLTCEEYLVLLESDIDKLEKMLPLKEEIISKIGDLEIERSEFINDLNSKDLFSSPINKAGDLILFFSNLENSLAIPALKNLNALLIDIIQKIQDQNKKNQIFLNKAMISLREIRRGQTGIKQYTTYGADGQTRAPSRP